MKDRIIYYATIAYLGARRISYEWRLVFWVWWYWGCDVESARATAASFVYDYWDSPLSPRAVALGFRTW